MGDAVNPSPAPQIGVRSREVVLAVQDPSEADNEVGEGAQLPPWSARSEGPVCGQHSSI